VPIDPCIPERAAGLTGYQVEMGLSDGANARAVVRHAPEISEDDPSWMDGRHEDAKAVLKAHRVGVWFQDRVWAHVFARDPEHAIKILSERRAMLLADPRASFVNRALNSLQRPSM
jgi:hypothetical protein